MIEGEFEVLVLPMPDLPGELAMIIGRLADASVNLRFVCLAIDNSVVIGADAITHLPPLSSRPRIRLHPLKRAYPHLPDHGRC